MKKPRRKIISDRWEERLLHLLCTEEGTIYHHALTMAREAYEAGREDERADAAILAPTPHPAKDGI